MQWIMCKLTRHKVQGVTCPGAHVKLRCPVFVQNSRDTSERTASLRDDGDSNGATDTTLVLAPANR